MPYKPIIGVLGYILSEDKKQVLLVHRTFRQDDDHLGKYNGLGGKVESNEDILAALIREIKEESNLDVQSATLRGTVNWTGFGPNGEDWLGFIFIIDKFTGEMFSENEEGTLHWVDLDSIMELPMWEGDRHFLPLLFDDSEKIFHGYMPYKNDTPMDWQFTRI